MAGAGVAPAQARPQKVRNDGAVNSGPKTASRPASEAGSGGVMPGIGGNPRFSSVSGGAGLSAGPHAGGIANGWSGPGNADLAVTLAFWRDI